MTIEETLKSLPAFQRLQKQQQAACLRYCQNGRDAKDAAVEAYPVPTGEGQVKRLAKTHKDFMSCVAAIFEPEAELVEPPSRKEFLSLLGRRIRLADADNKDFQLFAKIQGWLDDPKPQEPAENHRDYAAELEAFDQRG
jgi:hypothetical protein